MYMCVLKIGTFYFFSKYIILSNKYIMANRIIRIFSLKNYIPKKISWLYLSFQKI